MLIFLYGEDDFSSNEKLQQIKKSFLKNNPKATSIVFDFDEKKFNLNEVKSVVETDGLFSSKKIILLKNIFSNTNKIEQDEALNYLKIKKDIFSDKNLFLILWEGTNPRKNNKLFKFLSDNSRVEEFKKKQGIQLEKWIEEKVNKNNLQIEKDAINELMIYTGKNIWRLNNEIEKLQNYKKEKGIIIKSDIEKIVSSGTEANIFETVETLLQGNKKRALQMLHNQLEQGSDPFYILSMYIYQCRNLLKISSFYFQGISNQYEIAKLAKVHPFVAQKGMQQLQMTSLSYLKKIYKKLEQIDVDAKTGKADIKLLLDKFVISV